MCPHWRRTSTASRPSSGSRRECDGSERRRRRRAVRAWAHGRRRPLRRHGDRKRRRRPRGARPARLAGSRLDPLRARRPERRGARRAVRGRGNGAAGARRPRGAGRGRPDRDRAEQSLRLDRTGPRGAGDRWGDPQPTCPRRRRKPADRRQGSERSGRPDAEPSRRRHDPVASNTVLLGPDRRLNLRRGGRRGRAARPLDRHSDAHDGRRGAPPPRRGGPVRCGHDQCQTLVVAMRVAIVGGTGSFGRALAERVTAAGESVVIGSRDASRAKEIATVLGVEGATNEQAVGNADLVVLAVRSNAALETARELAPAIGETPLLSVASNLEFTDGGVLPGQYGDSLAEHIAEIVEAPVAAGLQTLAAVHLAGSEPPDEDVLVCGDASAAKDLSLDLGARLVKGRAIDAGPLANARALEGMTAVILNVNRRYKVHAGIKLVGLR